MKAAAAYVRVSSTGQLDGDGPERQQDAITRYARHNRCRVVKEFIDDESGMTDDRPAFAAMLEYCEAEGVSIVLVENIGRWGRHPLVIEMLIQQCRQSNLTVIDVSTGYNITDESADPVVKFLSRILAAYYAFEHDTLVAKLKAARERIRAKNGKCEGRKGYTDSPEGRQAIRRARTLRDAGKSFRAIAATLEREGHQTARGKPWRAGTVHGMLGEG